MMTTPEDNPPVPGESLAARLDPAVLWGGRWRAADRWVRRRLGLPVSAADRVAGAWVTWALALDACRTIKTQLTASDLVTTLFPAEPVPAESASFRRRGEEAADWLAEQLAGPGWSEDLDDPGRVVRALPGGGRLVARFRGSGDRPVLLVVTRGGSIAELAPLLEAADWDRLGPGLTRLTGLLAGSSPADRAWAVFADARGAA